MLAFIVLALWGKSIFATFTPKNTKVQPLPTVDLVQRSLTPTPTRWVISENIQSIPIPTQTPFIITATPIPTEIVDWYDNIYIPTTPGQRINPPDRKHDNKVIARISYYYPPYAYKDPAYEINCDKPDGVLECEYMSSGMAVIDNVGLAVACPAEYPFGTIFQIGNGYYKCLDRGGEIKRMDDNTIWLDVLYPYMINGMNWGESVTVKYWLPE